MAVLVTGGLGAIGSLVTRSLVRRGIRPLLYDARPDTTLVADVVDQVDLVTGDLLDLPTLLRTILERGVDRIIHLAALMPPPAQANPALGVQVNVVGTINVLEAARLAKVKRVVYTSSKSVYGEFLDEHGHPSYVPVSEDCRLAPMDVYGVTKLASEHLGLQYWQTFGVDFIAVRFAATFGPGKLVRHGVVGLQSQMVENALFGRKTTIRQGREQRNDMVYNQDCANAVILACFAEQVQHRVFNIGSGRLTTLGDLAAAIRTVVPNAEIEIGPGLNYFGHNTYCLLDISRAQTELGYRPEFALERGVQHYVDTLRVLGLVRTT